MSPFERLARLLLSYNPDLPMAPALKLNLWLYVKSVLQHCHLLSSLATQMKGAQFTQLKELMLVCNKD